MSDDFGQEVMPRLRAEVARLRTENARLSRLLDLRGQDTSPGAEQLAVASAGGILTRQSPEQDKVAFYGSLFRARPDVYAVRRRTRRGMAWLPARAGWRPEGGWARQLPLTPQTIEDHLRGRAFIGLYPLLRDNSCHFLAADFDGPAAMLDALAYTKAARAQGVPAAVELSQSGRGAHVWIFFSAAMPAATARAVGSALIHEATVLRGTMDLQSYDRLFPNQDVLPSGGYGNLIAAPLQGERRRDGLTTFLDPATLEPYDDQWLFLSTLDRLDRREADALARRATAVTVGAGVAKLSRATSTAVHPQMSSVVRVELGAGLTIRGEDLTPAALSTFKHAASIANPRFYELQRLRKSTWDTARYVRGYDVTAEDDLVLPRGLRETLQGMINSAESRLELTDVRQAGTEIEVQLDAELTDRQSHAVSVLLGHDDGILVAPPGAGKTVMACAMIAERCTSTLILVDRKALADQWRTQIQRFLGVKPGQLGGGRRRLSGVVDIAMMPTLARRVDVAAVTEAYGQVIVDECHHLGAASYEDAVKKVAAQFWLGLTATPQRRDGLDELITWQLGPIRHTIDDQEIGTLEAAVDDAVLQRDLTIHRTTFSFDAEDSDATEAAVLAATQQALAIDSERNAQIVDDVATELAAGRNCLVLTRRVVQLEELSLLLADRGCPSLVLQGGMTVQNRRAVLEELAELAPGDGRLVIGTTPFIGEGFDAPALDTLFLAGPISFDGLLLQCVGRVIRSCPGKSSAAVHDYHDVNVSWLAGTLKKRMPGYRALQFVEHWPEG